MIIKIMLKNESKILLGLTTTDGSAWRTKIKEIDKLGLKEIALFPTCLKIEQRKELYGLLEKTGLKEIPHVHLRSDHEEWEFKYLAKRFKTLVFNIHSKLENPVPDHYLKYRKLIYIENIYKLFDEKELASFAGICLDLAHLENDRITEGEKFNKLVEIIPKYPIGCNHIGAVKKITRCYDEEGNLRYDWHNSDNLSDFDYLKNFPKKYFSAIISIELENTLTEQLAIKEYIKKLLSER